MSALQALYENGQGNLYTYGGAGAAGQVTPVALSVRGGTGVVETVPRSNI